MKENISFVFHSTVKKTFLSSLVLWAFISLEDFEWSSDNAKCKSKCEAYIYT